MFANRVDPAQVGNLPGDFSRSAPCVNGVRFNDECTKIAFVGSAGFRQVEIVDIPPPDAYGVSKFNVDSIPFEVRREVGGARITSAGVEVKLPGALSMSGAEPTPTPPVALETSAGPVQLAALGKLPDDLEMLLRDPRSVASAVQRIATSMPSAPIDVPIPQIGALPSDLEDLLNDAGRRRAALDTFVDSMPSAPRIEQAGTHLPEPVATEIEERGED